MLLIFIFNIIFLMINNFYFKKLIYFLHFHMFVFKKLIILFVTLILNFNYED